MPYDLNIMLELSTGQAYERRVSMGSHRRPPSADALPSHRRRPLAVGYPPHM